MLACPSDYFLFLIHDSWIILKLFFELKSSHQFDIIKRYKIASHFDINNFSNSPNPEKMFRIKTVPSCPGKILQTYQADEISEINIAGKFLVKTKDQEFHTTIYPFLQTDYLVDQLTGKATD